MTLVFLVLRGTAINMTNATWFLEIASYVLVTGFGAWLLWQKAGPRVARLFGHDGDGLGFGHRHAHAHASSHSHSVGGDGAFALAFITCHGRLLPQAQRRRPMSTPRPARMEMSAFVATPPVTHKASASVMEVCESCGHSHAPDPALHLGRQFQLEAPPGRPSSPSDCAPARAR